MTQPPAPWNETRDRDDDTQTRDVAKNEAASVASDAKENVQQVASTATDQAKQVAGEAKGHAKDLYAQARSEFADQASSQQGRAASGLRSLAGELDSMASHQGSGVATDLAQQAATKANQVAGWLESREPGDVIDELSSFARRRPGAFLLGAAVLGLVGGRLTRGLAAEAQDSQSSDGRPLSTDVSTPRTTPVHTSASPTPITPMAPGVTSPSPTYGGERRETSAQGGGVHGDGVYGDGPDDLRAP